MMRRLRQGIRYTAYGCGIAGAVLMLVARGMTGETSGQFRLIAAVLLLGMFALFVVSYIWIVLDTIRKSGPSR